MIYEPLTNTRFISIIPNPTHAGEYIPETLEDAQFIQRVNQGMVVIKERHLDQVHDKLSPDYGLLIKYPPSPELPEGENCYLYPNE